MGRITSNVGLITGLPITETVDQLMKVAGAPRDLLTKRTEDLQSQQLAVNTLATRLLSVQFELGKLGKESLFDAKQVTSSDETLLSAAVETDGNPVAANYLFTPVQSATSQQLISQRFADLGDAFSAGSLSFRTGGFVDKGISVEQLNQGAGIARGSIRITDKNGDSAVIDLSKALTVDDVVESINASTAINVTATAEGDAFRLTDNSGQSGTLSVQEVNGGTTAADLGLLSISAAGGTTTALGDDVFSLHEDTSLSQLNDGNGVYFTDDESELDDLLITLADGTSAGVDLSGATTLGDVVEAINNDEDFSGKLTAAIAEDGNRLELTDLTSGGGSFTVSNGILGTAAEDLGLTNTAAGGVITGERLVAGLQDTLLASINGGNGIATLGDLQITNRSGVLSTVDLSGAETVKEVIDAINSQATDVTAAINSQRSGIVLTDTTGSTASNLIVASGGGATVAEDLNLVIDDAVDSVDSGSLNRQTLSEASLLKDINGGSGVAKIGDIKITDTNGVSVALDLNNGENPTRTIGEVIDAINATSLGIEARINDTGDAIVLVDTAGGEGEITVTDLNGTLSADLGLAGTSTEVEVEGTPTQVLDGSSIQNIEIEEGDTLATIVDKINDSNSGVLASILNDGQGYRLSLTVEKTGSANQLLLDLQDSNFRFQEIAQAQDAVLAYGNGALGGGGVLLTSSDNTFDEVVDGLNLTLHGTSDTPVNVSVSEDEAPLISAVEGFVKAYNSLRDHLEDATSFDETDMSTGLLFGTNEALRVDTELSRALTDRYFGLGSFESLEQIGIGVTDEGTLELDKTKLSEAFNTDPAGLEKFFAEETIGVVAKFNDVVDRLAGEENGLLSNRSDALQNTIDTNDRKLEQLNESLERQRERTLLQFFQLEQVIAGMQQNQTALAGLQPLPPLGTTSGT